MCLWEYVKGYNHCSVSEHVAVCTEHNPNHAAKPGDHAHTVGGDLASDQRGVEFEGSGPRSVLIRRRGATPPPHLSILFEFLTRHPFYKKNTPPKNCGFELMGSILVPTQIKLYLPLGRCHLVILLLVAVMHLGPPLALSAPAWSATALQGWEAGAR